MIKDAAILGRGRQNGFYKVCYIKFLIGTDLNRTIVDCKEALEMQRKQMGIEFE